MLSIVKLESVCGFFICHIFNFHCLLYPEGGSMSILEKQIDSLSKRLTALIRPAWESLWFPFSCIIASCGLRVKTGIGNWRILNWGRSRNHWMISTITIEIA